MMKLFHMGIYEGFAEKEQDQKGYRGGEERPSPQTEHAWATLIRRSHADCAAPM